MKQSIRKKVTLMLAVLGWAWQAQAGQVTTMKIISPAQSVAKGACSSAVTVRAQDDFGNAAAVPVKTQIFFTGSTSDLMFYNDSFCSNRVTSVFMVAGTSSKKFYFKDNYAGSKTLIVATYNYNDDQQIETIGSGTTSTTTTTTSSTSTTTTLPVATISTTTTTLSSNHIGRAIPAPIYGVTLDDVSNVSGIVSSLKAMARFPTSRIVFDKVNGPSYYSGPIQQMRSSTYIMGQILDSTDMATTSVSAYQTRSQNYMNSLGGLVDVWEIGNEINGGWVGTDTKATGDKVRAAYDVVHGSMGATALTFFYEGEPNDPNNCVDGPGYDMFGWIQNFLANPENDRVRLGLDYVFVSWYPQQCNNLQPDWPTIFKKLSSIFPNAKVGFGEIGTANPQGGSSYEVNLLNQFYPMGNNTALPSTYVGGYFWWYFVEEMVPTTKTTLFNTMNNAILQGP